MSPDASYKHASDAFLHGDLRQSQDEAERGYQEFRPSNPEWAWKFRILEARAALWRGLYPDVLKLLGSLPPPPDEPHLTVPRLTLLAVANIYLHNFPKAESDLHNATTICEAPSIAGCGDVLQARGFLASERGESTSAEHWYELSLSFARSRNDQFLECNSLLNLGAESLVQGRFDEAIERSESAVQVAMSIGARAVEVVAKGNIGWAYYKLGDLENASKLLVESEKLAAQLQSISNQENELTNLGYVHMDERRFDRAEQSFRRALEIAQGIAAKEDTYNALRVLARLELQTGNLDHASQFAEEALIIAKKSGNHLDELYPLLVQGQIAARRGNLAAAENTFHEVELDKLCPVFLKWEAQHSLASLYDNNNQPDAADREYRAALATFEGARAEVRHEDSHLSFLTNGWRIYDDYVHFLVARGKTNDALRWADHSRARTLSEELGFLLKGAVAAPPPLNAPEIARRSQGTVLYYWLGEKQSYLWAITPQKTTLFPLPPAAEIDAAVKRYRTALGGPQDVLAYGDNDGRWLYRTLVAPAQPLLPKDGTVFVVPDGSLNNLNFETLLVSENSSQFPVLSSQKETASPKLHYWIEDATVASASSLRALGAPYASATKRARRLLLVGNSIAPNDKYPELARAAAQMEAVAGHFPVPDRKILSRAEATPAAYIDSHPEQFTHLHFVAHGTASRLSPLDSAIVLSRSSTDRESFKLYARDIIRHPLSADLVTISACYGTGERSYAGEGLVGLSWAFLRAGAHNVIAALWDVADTSTEKLMSRFYEELDRGVSPSAALRTAKLSLLRSEGLRNPFYWAPFQMYTQGGPVKPRPARAKAQSSKSLLRRGWKPRPFKASHEQMRARPYAGRLTINVPTGIYAKARVTRPATIPRATTTA